MHRFYADPDRSTPDVIVLTPEDARHALTVLRLKPGHHIEAVLNHSRMEAVIEQTDKQEVIARRISLNHSGFAVCLITTKIRKIL